MFRDKETRQTMDDILIEKKIQKYHDILREKGVKIKNIHKMKDLMAYNSNTGKPKTEEEIDILMAWAESLEPHQVEEVNECSQDA